MLALRAGMERDAGGACREGVRRAGIMGEAVGRAPCSMAQTHSVAQTHSHAPGRGSHRQVTLTGESVGALCYSGNSCQLLRKGGLQVRGRFLQVFLWPLSCPLTQSESCIFRVALF